MTLGRLPSQSQMSRDRKLSLEPSCYTQTNLCKSIPQPLLSQALCRARQQTTRSSPYTPSPLKLFKLADHEPAYPASPVPFHENHNEDFPTVPLDLPLPPNRLCCFPLWFCMACPPPPLGNCNELSFQWQLSPYLLASPVECHWK